MSSNLNFFNKFIPVSAIIILLMTISFPASAGFLATGDITGLQCNEDGSCYKVDYDKVKIKGGFSVVMGSVFDAVTNLDSSSGVCRIDLNDIKLADASDNMKNLLNASFIKESHDGDTVTKINTLEFLCVEE